VINHVQYFELELDQNSIEKKTNIFNHQKLNHFLTMAEASIRLPNFCLINGLQIEENISFVCVSSNKITYLLCRHRKICIGMGITSSLSDAEIGLDTVSR
jgi:hypothetical protein